MEDDEFVEVGMRDAAPKDEDAAAWADAGPRAEVRMRLPVSAAARVADPSETPPWPRCAGWSRDEVLRRAAERDYGAHGHLPWGMNAALRGLEDHAPAHAARVAWLMNNELAPEATFGAEEILMGNLDWPVLDGNHRLAAAILRGDAEIDIVISGHPEAVAEVEAWLRDTLLAADAGAPGL